MGKTKKQSLMLEAHEIKCLVGHTALVQLSRQLHKITNDYTLTTNTMIAVLLAKGCDSTEIADLLDLDLEQVNIIERQEDIQNIVFDIQQALIENPMLIIDTMIPRAIRALERTLDCGDAKTELAAANSLLDRKYGKAINRQMSIDTHNYTFTITNGENTGKQCIQEDLPFVPALPEATEIIEGEITEITEDTQCQKV